MKKSKSYSLFFLCWLCTVLILGCGTAQDSKDELSVAAGLIEKGENEAAIDILRPYIYKNHNSFEAYMLAGQAFLNKNVNDKRNLYLARYYFSTASKVAEYDEHRQKADQAHADIRLMMGITGKSADTVLEAAKRAQTLGFSGQAVKLYLQAANLFVQDSNYDDAIKSCQDGLLINPNNENKAALKCMLARAYFLNENYDNCMQACQTIEGIENERIELYVAEKAFLKAALRFLKIHKERKVMQPWKKEYVNGDAKEFKSSFNQSIESLKELKNLSGENQFALFGKYSLILAIHAKDNDRNDFALKAYEYSRKMFRDAKLEAEALKVGEEIEKIKS